MLKPAKQHKPDQPRDTAEDPVDLSAVNTSIEHVANAKSASPELSFEVHCYHGC